MRKTSFYTDRDGNILIISALVLPVLVFFFGLVIDAAAINLQKRQLQKAVDMAAISAATAIDDAEALAAMVLRDHGVALESVDDARSAEPLSEIYHNASIVKGRYTADINQAKQDRFIAGKQPYNAVKVAVRNDGIRYFNPFKEEPLILTKTATASATSHVAMSLGSRLASFEGGIANKLLSELTGSEISLTAMDYNSLADLDVSLFGFLDTLASETNITAGTYDDVVEADITVGLLAGALAKSAGSHKAFDQLSSNRTALRLSEFIDLGETGAVEIANGKTPLETEIAALDIISAAALFANEDSQIEIDLDTDVSSLFNATVTIAIGERAQHSGWFTVGSRGEVLRTAQTRLRINLDIGSDDLPGGGIVTLPLYLDIAYAEASVSDAQCTYNDDSSRQTTIHARPGVLNIWIGETSGTDFRDFGSAMNPSPATLVSLRLADITGRAHAEIGNMSAKPLYFTANDIEAGTIRTVSTSQYTSSLTTSLLEDLVLDVDVLGLNLGLGDLPATVNGILDDVTPELDALLKETLQTLGLSLGEADVRVHDVRCNLASLVD